MKTRLKNGSGVWPFLQDALGLYICTSPVEIVDCFDWFCSIYQLLDHDFRNILSMKGRIFLWVLYVLCVRVQVCI